MTLRDPSVSGFINNGSSVLLWVGGDGTLLFYSKGGSYTFFQEAFLIALPMGRWSPVEFCGPSLLDFGTLFPV